MGALAFLASLTPSLIPRSGSIQGAVAGVSFAAAYGIAGALRAVYLWLGFKPLGDTFRTRMDLILLGASIVMVLFGLANATGCQNDIHRVMGIAEVETARPFIIAGVALLTLTVLILLERILRRLSLGFTRRLGRILPPRVTLLSGFAAAVLLAWSLGNGLLQRGLFRALDSSYREFDALVPPEQVAPESVQATGGPGSLVAWDGIGREGRNWIVAGPMVSEIEQLTGRAALAPLRVYVGLNSADTPEDRAALALAELIRVGAFDREVLVIATPTGTGWVDPAGMTPAELLQGGNIASVSVQYSYLPSWLSLYTEPDNGVETAREVFAAVYGHWHRLPPKQRPRLFLFGLSLGALNTEQSFEFYDIVGDPFDGALLAGPPYPSPIWREITRKRNPGSPAWLPVVGDQSLFRFANQWSPRQQVMPWGSMGILYLQYASDPIVFLDTAMIWRRPQWLDQPRGPDVAPEMRWIPLVSFLQVACDAMIAAGTPSGTGHVYAGEHYLAAWSNLLEKPGLTQPEQSGLSAWLRQNSL